MTVSDTVIALLLFASAAEAGGRGVTLASLDGTPLTGERYEASPRPAPGVVLIHMLTRNKSDWDSLANRRWTGCAARCYPEDSP